MEENQDTFDTGMRRFWKIIRLAFMTLLVPLILLFFFGFFVKTTEEYACAVDLLEHNSQVEEQIDHPLKMGFFAWLPYFESGGGVRQGAFSTTISGPSGQGKVRVEFYRTPVGDSLYLQLGTKAGEITLYDGAYPCR